MNQPIAVARLYNQSLTHPRHRRPADVVAWLGAVQAQEFEPAKWALGLRMADAADAAIHSAIDDGRILRTHVMRPTWHFVTPADIRWMLDLTGPGVQRRMAAYNRQLELDARVLTRGTAIVETALGGREYLTRTELGERLQRAGLPMTGIRLAHLAMHAEQEGVICSGPRRGKQSTYGLISERAPGARRLPRDESIAELTRRFLRSHGPATVRDFVWWSGLSTPDAKRGLEMNKASRQEADGIVYWHLAGGAPADADRAAHFLPIYDEYLVSYRDRTAVPHGPSTIAAARGSVTFQHALIVAGEVAGTWRISRKRGAVSIDATLLRPPTRGEPRLVAEAAERYAQFLGVPVELSVG